MIDEANRARAAGIRVFAIGVGEQATQEMLDQIANQPTSMHTFRVDQFRQLDDIIKRVSAATCKVVEAGKDGKSLMRWSHCSSCKLRPFVVCCFDVEAASSTIELAASTGPQLFLHQKTITVHRYVVVMVAASSGKYNNLNRITREVFIFTYLDISYWIINKPKTLKPK